MLVTMPTQPSDAVPLANQGSQSALSTNIVLKALMALSGFVWAGFLVAHLGSNLNVFGGPESINDYYAWLESNTFVYWAVRVMLLATLVPHVFIAFVLVRRGFAARGQRYHLHRKIQTSWAARAMMWTGPLLLVFIVYHLLHLTVGVMPGDLPYRPDDKYQNIVASFGLWPVALFYLLAIAALGLHLWHGVWSAVRSLGASHPRIDSIALWTAHVVATLLVLGFSSIPLAVWLGLLT